MHNIKKLFNFRSNKRKNELFKFKIETVWNMAESVRENGLQPNFDLVLYKLNQILDVHEQRDCYEKLDYNNTAHEIYTKLQCNEISYQEVAHIKDLFFRTAMTIVS